MRNAGKPAFENCRLIDPRKQSKLGQMKTGLSTLLLSSFLFAGGTGQLRSENTAATGVGPTLPSLVSEKCSGCHPPPQPETMPRYAWEPTIRAMLKFMARARVPITDTQLQGIAAFYTGNSPERLAQLPDNFADSLLKFKKIRVGNPPSHERPQVTSVKFTDLDGDGRKDDIVVTDNNSSEVSWLRKEGEKWTETKIGEAPAPVNSTPFDFDGDGDVDLAISAMGYMHPNDKLIGEFHLMINQGGGKFDQHLLVQGVPRITDCAPADFDGDGDMDFILAMFGWRETGGVGYLEQVAPMKFKLRTILAVNGCMRVIVNDADHNGRPDFVALITQQHEAILQFTNQGGASFTNGIIARANYPSFGSSSIYLVDLDQDGDEDILYTNGDMMDDNPVPKPYHGLRWLENIPGGQYQLHYLAGMPGCYCAKPADMDGDGDLDVVFSALYFQWDQHDFPSLAWLENLSGDFKKFTARRISYAPSNLANIAIGDANGDEILDIIGGGMHVPGPLERVGRLTLWLGQGEKNRPAPKRDGE